MGDLIALQETWLSTCFSDAHIPDCKPPDCKPLDYSLQSFPRTTSSSKSAKVSHGGTALLVLELAVVLNSSCHSSDLLNSPQQFRLFWLCSESMVDILFYNCDTYLNSDPNRLSQPRDWFKLVSPVIGVNWNCKKRWKKRNRLKDTCDISTIPFLCATF